MTVRERIIGLVVVTVALRFILTVRERIVRLVVLVVVNIGL